MWVCQQSNDDDHVIIRPHGNSTGFGSSAEHLTPLGPNDAERMLQHLLLVSVPPFSGGTT